MTKNSNHLNNIDDDFTFICTLDDLEEGIGKRFIINDVEIAVFKIKSEVFALNNICPHQQTHLIYDGFIENDLVVCPAHGWKFNVKTGKKSSGGNGLTTYPVAFLKNKVYVKVHQKIFNW
ncbi:MAG: Rieske (2Fe-2S) protein [Ignavibacteria bacterium]|nr:Rieske (2Fe-2S) protein [Ignavibacteria bacterium]MBT8382487.1 Rieske (2Fe-2S) protein [Ignavibacteria bacterium]MBT8391806.1 Rieske (2Fe-2S) protein [Ignavibacteria bacterium]NNJ51867.1 Rieske (2Fe-2S) protein [Ignavibacteriaceae bacterium]NNL21924.1 Rieske (2Fe-2S) protein [Ignavibacteriaceae bacterium]